MGLLNMRKRMGGPMDYRDAMMHPGLLGAAPQPGPVTGGGTGDLAPAGPPGQGFMENLRGGKYNAISNALLGMGQGLLSRRFGEGVGPALGRGFGYAQQGIGKARKDQRAKDFRARLEAMGNQPGMDPQMQQLYALASGLEDPAAGMGLLSSGMEMGQRERLAKMRDATTRHGYDRQYDAANLNRGPGYAQKRADKLADARLLRGEDRGAAASAKEESPGYKRQALAEALAGNEDAMQSIMRQRNDPAYFELVAGPDGQLTSKAIKEMRILNAVGNKWDREDALEGILSPQRK